MAKAIKETPVLFGRDAKRFLEKITHNKEQKAPRDEYDRVMATYQKMKDKTK